MAKYVLGSVHESQTSSGIGNQPVPPGHAVLGEFADALCGQRVFVWKKADFAASETLTMQLCAECTEKSV